jgi:hypothetical protein
VPKHQPLQALFSGLVMLVSGQREKANDPGHDVTDIRRLETLEQVGWLIVRGRFRGPPGCCAPSLTARQLRARV